MDILIVLVIMILSGMMLAGLMVLYFQLKTNMLVKVGNKCMSEYVPQSMKLMEEMHKNVSKAAFTQTMDSLKEFAEND